MIYAKTEKKFETTNLLCNVREASKNVSNWILIWFIELRPHILRGGGLSLLFQDSRLFFYFLFLFHEGKIYENAGKTNKLHVSVYHPFRKNIRTERCKNWAAISFFVCPYFLHYDYDVSSIESIFDLKFPMNIPSRYKIK